MDETDTAATIEPVYTAYTTKATMFDPELTYHPDGTSVVMRWVGGERAGITRGMKKGAGYDWQIVEWPDGTTDAVAPHTLHLAADDVPVAHIERSDANGHPTGHALCGTTDGGLARNSGTATCGECERILGDGEDDPDDVAGDDGVSGA
jgi:hypothetical protein